MSAVVVVVQIYYSHCRRHHSVFYDTGRQQLSIVTHFSLLHKYAHHDEPMRATRATSIARFQQRPPQSFFAALSRPFDAWRVFAFDDVSCDIYMSPPPSCCFLRQRPSATTTNSRHSHFSLILQKITYTMTKQEAPRPSMQACALSIINCRVPNSFLRLTPPPFGFGRLTNSLLERHWPCLYRQYNDDTPDSGRFFLPNVAHFAEQVCM